jgi:uncharacterized protein YciI
MMSDLSGPHDRPQATDGRTGRAAFEETTMYLLNVSYTKPPAEVAVHAATHGEWVARCKDQGVLLFAGPKTSGLGGVIGMSRMPKSDLLKLLAEDSFVQHDVAEYQIVDFDCKAAQPAMAALIGS